MQVLGAAFEGMRVDILEGRAGVGDHNLRVVGGPTVCRGKQAAGCALSTEDGLVFYRAAEVPVWTLQRMFDKNEREAITGIGTALGHVLAHEFGHEILLNHPKHALLMDHHWDASTLDYHMAGDDVDVLANQVHWFGAKHWSPDTLQALRGELGVLE